MSLLQSRWYTVFLEYNIKEIQYVKGEKNALADALSRHPDPSSQPIDHLVPPLVVYSGALCLFLLRKHFIT
jgi:hypothetical protein